MHLSRLALVAILALGLSSAAEAVMKSMGGSLSIRNPSVGDSNVFELGPDTRFGSVSVAGTATGTSTARTILLPANQFAFTGSQFRSFPGFAGVAQLTFSSSTTVGAGIFAPGGGAVAAAGGPISFCPPIGNVPPASGTGTGGNRSCTFFNTPGVGNRPVRIGISNTNPTNFGGALSLLRNVVGNVWFVVNAPTPTSNIGVVSKQPNSNFGVWTPGQPNYSFVPDINLPGPNYAAVVTPMSGKVGTLISSLGLGTIDPDDGEAWGFKMTTGTLSGSDIYPPTTTSPAPPHFFFTSMGFDGIIGGQRNIILLGGAVARSGTGGNLFFRSMALSMTIPEPTTSLGLLAGVGILVALARAKRKP